MPFDSMIIVRYDQDEQRPVYDLGDFDEYSAVEILRVVADYIEARLPSPRANAELPEEEEEE